jgi:hypothetical protein
MGRNKEAYIGGSALKKLNSDNRRAAREAEKAEAEAAELASAQEAAAKVTDAPLEINKARGDHHWYVPSLRHCTSANANLAQRRTVVILMLYSAAVLP